MRTVLSSSRQGGLPQTRLLNFPLGYGPGDTPPQDLLQGMLGYHLQCMMGYHPPPMNRMTDRQVYKHNLCKLRLQVIKIRLNNEATAVVQMEK